MQHSKSGTEESFQKYCASRVLEAIPDEACMIDVESLEIVWSNTLFQERFLSRSPEDLPSRRCYSVLYQRNTPCFDEDLECPIHTFQKSRNTRDVYSLDHIHENGEGQEEYFETHIKPLFAESGELEYIFYFHRNITPYLINDIVQRKADEL